jgi:pimeloyl-ACP methyl ester carboxylesterase
VVAVSATERSSPIYPRKQRWLLIGSHCQPLADPHLPICVSTSLRAEMGNMVGAMQTCRAQGGCSVLGWNHPGFGASTGTPSPESEAHAIDAIIEFAQVKLGYGLGEIILHGWSIGGYSTSWAAMNHPGIRGACCSAPSFPVGPLPRLCHTAQTTQLRRLTVLLWCACACWVRRACALP